MKKIILPALISVVLLSSCSQALYKNSYDWVKVNRTETTIEKSNNAFQSSIVESGVEIASDTAITEEKSSSPNSVSDVAAAIEIGNVPTDTLSKTKRNSEVNKTQKEKRVNDGYLTINLQPKLSRANGWNELCTEDKGYIIAGICIVLLLILMAVFGPAAFIKGFLILYILVKAVASVVGAVLLIGGIYLLFKGFITMMDH